MRQQAAGRVCRPTRSEYEAPKPKDLYEIGTAADVLRMFSLPDGQRQIIVQGRRRFEIGEFIETDPLLIARVTMVEETDPADQRIRGENLTSASRSIPSLVVVPGADERIESDDRKDRRSFDR